MRDSMKPKVLIAENHPAMREKVVSLLECDFDVVASVAEGQEVARHLKA